MTNYSFFPSLSLFGEGLGKKQCALASQTSPHFVAEKPAGSNLCNQINCSTTPSNMVFEPSLLQVQQTQQQQNKEQNKELLRPYRYKCSVCGHETTLMLPQEQATVDTWCTCCSKNTEDNKIFNRLKPVEDI
ncbi:MAG: hypothetical protein FWD52_04720 [Candidatus Bathyarchaeota archaeon]|nr:hypothetical protein [Candidatus Termiticorpusculum sp.]